VIMERKEGGLQEDSSILTDPRKGKDLNEEKKLWRARLLGRILKVPIAGQTGKGG